MTIRGALIDQIVGVVGRDVHVIPFQDNADELDRITIMVKQVSLAPLPAAPGGALRVDYILTIASASIDSESAETELDEFVPGFLADMADLSWFVWDEANKVLFQSTHMAYDVACYVLATPKNT